MGKKKKQLSDEALVIAYRIREARAQKFKTIKDAAETLPVEKTLWSHWENARVKPQKMTMEKIAALLGVSIDFFYKEPDDWEAEKSRFLTELTSRTRVKKDYYKALSASLPSAVGDAQTPSKAEARPTMVDALGVFLEITKLITDAQKKVIDGEIAQETYDMHMRMIADMIKVSLFMRK